MVSYWAFLEPFKKKQFSTNMEKFKKLFYYNYEKYYQYYLITLKASWFA